MHDNDRFLELAQAPDARLDDLLALARTRYDVSFDTAHLGGLDVELLQIADLNAHIDTLMERAAATRQKLTLPFWAKLWPSSLPLAMLALRLKPAPGDSFLETGAGLGLCGLAAAIRGFETVITDIEPEALLFIRASILKNGLEGKARAARLDIAGGSLGRRFTVIAASEALYIPELHAPLITLFQEHLEDAPGAQIVLSCDRCREAMPFFAKAQQDYRIQRTETTCRTDAGESQTCVLYRMLRRTDA
uniref:Methyltransferase n=1 Tax=Fundidesulfovibrio putealis TaxID=270496 RepID=A0A7C3W898_9BACT